MELTLHRQLKEIYGAQTGGRCEMRVGGYRIDAVNAAGELIEVQTGAMGCLLGKLARLLYMGERVRVVKPLVVERRIVSVSRRGSGAVSERRSPRRGQLVDVFDDLMGTARLLDVPDFRIEFVEVAIRERREPSRRRRGYRVTDRELLHVGAHHHVESANDLWRLLPARQLPATFTTSDLALALVQPRHVAQRVAYCLRISGAATVVGKRGNNRLYQRRPGDGPRAATKPRTLSADSTPSSST